MGQYDCLCFPSLAKVSSSKLDKYQSQVIVVGYLLNLVGKIDGKDYSTISFGTRHAYPCHEPGLRTTSKT